MNDINHWDTKGSKLLSLIKMCYFSSLSFEDYQNHGWFSSCIVCCTCTFRVRWLTCTFWDVIVLSLLAFSRSFKKLIQCVSTIDLHVAHDADVSRRTCTSVATCKYELLITGLSQNKCASLITYHEKGFRGAKTIADYDV